MPGAPFTWTPTVRFAELKDTKLENYAFQSETTFGLATE
jgi:hypothetical protein